MSETRTRQTRPSDQPEPADFGDQSWLVSASAQLNPSDDVVASVTDNLRRRLANMPRFGHPLNTDDGQVKLSDIALKRLLANTIRQSTGRAVRSVDIDVADGEATRLSVNLCARYGDDMPAMDSQVRGIAQSAMSGVLGHGPATSATGVLELKWVDIESAR